MPIIDSLVPETTKQCIEVVSEQIVNRLIKHLGFENLFTNNDNLFIESDDLKSSNFNDSADNIRSQNNRCNVKIIPGYNGLENKFDIVSSRALDPAINTPRWTVGEYPIFSDKRSNVYVIEVNLPTTVELQFEIKLKSIELSDAFNLALYSRSLVNGGIADYNDIQFSYGFPDKLLYFIYKIFKMQDDLSDIDFKDYLRVGSNAVITPVVNRDRLNGDVELVFQKTNSKVLGLLEYDGDKHDTEDFNKVSNRYVINFSYFVQFAKPVVLRTTYPVMIYNKIIPEQYLCNTPNNMSIGEGKQFIGEIAINNYFLQQNKARIRLEDSYPLVRQPYFDDWQRSPAMYSNVSQHYQPLFIGLIGVDVNQDELSLSVNFEEELFPLLNPKMVEELKYCINNFDLDTYATNAKDDLFRRLGIFDIGVFCNDSVVSFDRLKLSPDYVLTISGNLDITKIYRLVISQIKDMSILSRLYICYIITHPDYYEDLIAANMEYLVEYGYVKIITDQITAEQSALAETRKVKDVSWAGYPNRGVIINNYMIEVIRNH